MSRRSTWPLVMLLGLLMSSAPGALAHTEDNPRDTSHLDAPEDPAAPEGYTGPGREPYLSYFQGTWLYGKATVTPLHDQRPRDLDGHEGWLVWEDALRADIYAFNIAAGQGYYVTQDSAVQRRPQISEGVIVWEDYRDGPRPRIYAHFLETGETRLITNGTHAHRRPSIDGAIVAWEDERHDAKTDIYAYSFLNDTIFPVQVSDERESDPLVLRDQIYWRTYRYNVWDVVGHDLTRHENFPVTSDASIQGAPFSNGRDVYFLTQQEQAWRLQKYDVNRERVADTPIRSNYARASPADGDRLIHIAYDANHAQLVARNLTSGATTHVTGNLVLVSEPILMGRTIFVVVKTQAGASLLQLDVSSFAFARKPTLSITSPGSVTSWMRPVTVQGILTAGEGWTEPLTFTYRVNDGPPQIIPAGERWRFTLDNAGFEPGSHYLSVVATFREGPPIETGLTLVVPQASRSVDVEEAGPAFHAARVLAELNIYVLQNPAAYLLVPLVLALLVLVGIRLWLWMRPRREISLVEYVPPEDA